MQNLVFFHLGMKVKILTSNFSTLANRPVFCRITTVANLPAPKLSTERKTTLLGIGSISAALSCLVCVPRGRSAFSFPEQRLVIEPTLAMSECKSSQVYLGEANNKQIPPRKQLIQMNCRIMIF